MGPTAAQPQQDAISDGDGQEKDGRWFHVSGKVQYRQTLVTDDDPANDRYMIYTLTGTVDIPRVKGLTGWLTLEVLQRTWNAEEGESGLFFQDMSLGGTYEHKLEVLPKGQPWFSFEHSLGVYLPTSRLSQARDMIFTPEILSLGRVHTTLHNLVAGISLLGQWRYHRYAERAGLEGTMNTKFVFGPGLFLEETIFKDKPYGKLDVRFSLARHWAVRYASREDYESEASDERYVANTYSWSMAVTYSPIKYASARIGLEHNAPMIRGDGAMNADVFNRNDTEIALAVIGKY